MVSSVCHEGLGESFTLQNDYEYMNSTTPARFKLIFVNRYFAPDQSATSQILTDLAGGLTRRGFNVHVVCSAQLYDNPDARLERTEQLAGVTVHRIATTRFGRHRLAGRAIDYASFYLSCALKLLKLLTRGDIVVAKTDPPLVSLVCALAVKMRGAALINWQQDVFPEIASLLGSNPLPRWLDALLRRWRDASLRAAKMNVVIGSRMLQYFVRAGIPAAQLCVIENWADARQVVPKLPSASALRARLGLLDRFVVGYSGNLGRAHEFETILGAAKALESEPVFAFLIIGGGAKIPAFKRAVAECGLNNVRFLPYQPRDALDDSLAAADVHMASLLPSLEGFIVPSKFYGILAAGRPVVFVGDPDGELSRIILAAQCGLVVNVAACDELATQLCRLRATPNACAAMGRRARELLSEKYDTRAAIEKWSAMLLGLKEQSA
jgi:colanic acid biosynthesis glycosyl transferase WcaI